MESFERLSGAPRKPRAGKHQARIAIIDGLSGGHHPEFAGRFARLASEQWANVEVLTADPERISALTDLSLRIDVVKYSWPSLKEYSRLRRALSKALEWRRLGRIVREREIDAVFLAYADFLLDHLVPASFVSSVLGVRWTGLWFHPMHLRVPKLARRPDFRFFPPERLLRVKSCAGIGVLDEGVVEHLGRALPNTPVVAFPDRPNDAPPSLPEHLVRQVRERAAGRRICVLAGSLAPRKGIGTLLHAARRLQCDWFFVLAGRIASKGLLRSEDIALFIEAERNQLENVWLIPIEIPNEAEFNGWIAIADVVYAAYEDFPHSSNLVGKAALFEKPVIVTEGYLMAERVHRFGLGLTVPSRDAEAVVTALSHIASSNLPDGMRSNGRRTYLEDHSERAERTAWGTLTAHLVFDRPALKQSER